MKPSIRSFNTIQFFRDGPIGTYVDFGYTLYWSESLEVHHEVDYFLPETLFHGIVRSALEEVREKY